MSNSLVTSGGFFPSKLDRQVSRALEQIDAGTLVALRRDEARLIRVAGTARQGMVRAAEIGALEATLGQVAPHAAAYVHASAVAGALGIAEVVYDATRSQ
jgi:alkylhydroperoxidase/carboxymuconolactone decarboxylase family protein YurZ